MPTGSRKRWRNRVVLESLERRELLASRLAAITPAQVERLQWAQRRPALLTGDQNLLVTNEEKPKPPDAKDKVTIKRLRTVVYGVLVPAPLVTDGKSRGAAIISADVVWLLDLTAVKGFDVYAQQLLQLPVVAFGSGEISKDAKGEIKRKFSVNWMEPLMDTTIAPAILGRHPVKPPVKTAVPAGPRLPLARR